MFGNQAPEKAVPKREGVPSNGGQRTVHMQRRAGDEDGGGSTFKARMLERKTPPGACDLRFRLRSDVCQQVNRAFSHLLAAGTALPVAV